MGEVVDQRLDQLTVSLAEVARGDQLQGGPQAGVLLQPGHRVVALALQLAHLLGVVAEQEEVLGTNPVTDLDVGPIEGADREGAVECHLHVAGARSLLAGR